MFISTNFTPFVEWKVYDGVFMLYDGTGSVRMAIIVMEMSKLIIVLIRIIFEGDDKDKRKNPNEKE